MTTVESRHLRRNLEGDAVAVRTAPVRRTVEITCAVSNQIAEGEQAVSATSKDVELVVCPDTTRECQLVNSSGIISTVAMCRGVNLSGPDEKVAEASRNAPPGQVVENGEGPATAPVRQLKNRAAATLTTGAALGGSAIKAFFAD